MAEQLETTVAGMDDEALFGAASRIEESIATRGAAARELTRRDPETAGPLLARLARDQAAPPESRATASVALGKHPSPEAEAALEAALTASEPLVVRRAAEALGRIGGPEALAALKRVPVPGDRAAARSLRFARSLVAYRLGLNEELLSASPPAQMRGESVALAVAPASAPAKAEVTERLPRELPGIAVRAEAAVRIECERNEMLVLPASAAAPMQRASAVAAVVMKRAHSLGHFATNLYILSHPTGGERVDLTGVRPDGTITHKGEAWPEDGALRFRLEALATPLADPVIIEGTMSAEGVVAITEARVATGPRLGVLAPRRNELPTLPHPVLGKAPTRFRPRVRGQAPT